MHAVWAHNLRVYDAHNEYVHITFLINDHTLNCFYLINTSHSNVISVAVFRFKSEKKTYQWSQLGITLKIDQKRLIEYGVN